MSQLVIDASVAIAAILVEDRTAQARDMIRRAATGLIAPVIWPIEVGNVLLLAERRGRFSAERRGTHLRYLAAMPVTIDPDGPAHAWTTTMDLARRHRLTLYDATYLELAVRRRLPLATFDTALALAATTEACRSRSPDDRATRDYAHATAGAAHGTTAGGRIDAYGLDVRPIR